MPACVPKEEDLLSLPNKFVNFSSYLGMPIVGFEKEIRSLLKKLEARKWCGAKGAGSERSHYPVSHFERELHKLESSVNYNSSPCTIKGNERITGASTFQFVFSIRGFGIGLG